MVALWEIHVHWIQNAVLNKCSPTTYIFDFTSLRWPGDVCSDFYDWAGHSLPLGTHVWFPWGFVPLIKIMRMHPRT